MNYIVNLHLNEIGRKALGTDEKTIIIDAEIKGNLANAAIDEVFPISLVKSYDIKPSFTELPTGSHVAVVKDGIRYLGEILGPDMCYKNRICVKVYMYEPDVTYTEIFEFHPDGTEVTHNKNKYHLDSISADEVEDIMNKLKNKQFIKMLSMLLDKDDVKIDDKTPSMPEWLTDETVDKINNLLNIDFNAYYNN